MDFPSKCGIFSPGCKPMVTRAALIDKVLRRGDAIRRSALSCWSVYKNKARIKSGPFSHEAGRVFLSFLQTPPGRMVLSPAAGGTIPPSTWGLCLAPGSVGNSRLLHGSWQPHLKYARLDWHAQWLKQSHTVCESLANYKN